jgi:hypothetical protein
MRRARDKQAVFLPLGMRKIPEFKHVHTLAQEWN